MSGVQIHQLCTLGLAGHVVALSLMIIGVATTDWTVFTYKHIGSAGLFKACTSTGLCRNIDADSTLKNVQATCLTGIVLGFLALCIGLVFVAKAVKRPPRSKGLVIASLALSFAGGLTSFVGDLIYEVDVYSISSLGLDLYLDSYLGYSFAVSMAGSILLMLTGSFVLQGTNRMIAALSVREVTAVSAMQVPGFVFHSTTAASLYGGQPYPPQAFAEGQHCYPATQMQFGPPPLYEHQPPGAPQLPLPPPYTERPETINHKQ